MPAILSLFSYRGGIGRAKYFLAALIAFACAATALLFMAMASDPKGGDGPLILALPLLVVSLWIFTAAVTKRLREAGWPLWMKLAFAVSPALWFMAGTIADSTELVVALACAALIFTPALAGPSSHTVQA